ncbi:hypothetical protein GE09DRAFT_1221187 [Coniochaeta sp. 2T2.1]|nr:hypothetical protein GE09DRAFT_1221187 [Coniochaeta sp. 2T2.1]
MKFSTVVLSLIPAVFGEVISPAEPSADCHADNCYRAVAGDDVRFEFKSRREDCSKFMATASPATTAPTVKPTKTAVRAIHVHAVAARAESDPAAKPTGLPVYASLCDSPSAYSSACSCWGITTAGRVNANAVPTAAATTPIGISSLSSALSSSRSISNSTTPASSTPTTIVSSVLSSATLPTTRSSISPSLSSTIKSSTSPSSSRLSSSSSSAFPTTTSPTTTTPTTSLSSTTTSTTSSSSTSTRPTTSTTTSPSTSPTPTPCPGGGKCGTYRSWPCNGPLGDCLCGTDADGKSFCFEDNVCSLETNCLLNADCPSATQRCVIGSCCEVGKCVIERKDGVCGNVNSGRSIFRRGARRGGEEGEGKEKRCVVGRNSGSY